MRESSSGARCEVRRSAKLKTTVMTMLLTGGALGAQAAWAQDPPPQAPPPTLPSAESATPPPGAPPAAEVAPSFAPPVGPPTVISPPAPPPPAPVPSPAGPDYKKINVGVGLRVGARFQNSADPGKVNDFGLDEVYVEPRFSGAIAPMFAWQANFNAGVPINTAPGQTGTAALMDLIAKFDAHSSFHLWAGRMLVPSDRSNFSGPWFIAAGKYPGTAFPTYVGPRTGPTGRDNGVTLWGEFGEGKAKYYLSAFNLNDVNVSPLYAGRINLALIGSESGFYHSSTYYGSQDVVALGGGFQFQNNAGAAGGGVNHTVMNVDLLAEKNLGSMGVVSLEGAYYHYPQYASIIGDMAAPVPVVKNQFFVVASYLTPEKIGAGKLNPLVRWQQTSEPNWKVFDAYLTYVMDDYFLRTMVGYQRTDFGGNSIAGNAILLGVQMQR